MNILKYTIHAVSAAALLSLASCSPDVEIKELPFDVKMTCGYDEPVPQDLVVNAVGTRYFINGNYEGFELSLGFNHNYGYNWDLASITTTQPVWMQFVSRNFEADAAKVGFESVGSINSNEIYNAVLMFAPNTTNARREGTLKIDYKYQNNSKSFEVKFAQEPTAHVDEPVSFTIVHDSEYNSTYAKIVYPKNVYAQPNSVFLVPVKARDNSQVGTALNPEVRMIIARNYMLQRGPGACLYTEVPPYEDNGINFHPQESGQYEDTEEGTVYYPGRYNSNIMDAFSEFEVYTMSYGNNGEPAGFGVKKFTVK